MLRALGAEEDMAHSSIRCFDFFMFCRIETLPTSTCPQQYRIWSCLYFQVWHWQVYIGRWGLYLIIRMSEKKPFHIFNFCRLDTQSNELWKRSIDWEICLHSGIWSRFAEKNDKINMWRFYISCYLNIRTGLIWRQFNGLNTDPALIPMKILASLIFCEL